MARVLLIDDHPDTRDVLAQLLSLNGLQVDACDSGEDALRRLASEMPDAVICDDRLPGMSGLELLQLLRGDRRYLDLPIIITSAAETPRETALESGASEFWLKGSTTLFDRVEEFCQKLRQLPARA